MLVLVSWFGRTMQSARSTDISTMTTFGCERYIIVVFFQTVIQYWNETQVTSRKDTYRVEWRVGVVVGHGDTVCLTSDLIGDQYLNGRDNTSNTERDRWIGEQTAEITWNQQYSLNAFDSGVIIDHSRDQEEMSTQKLFSESEKGMESQS